MRTDDEKLEFAKACLEIEKKGGNVQEYIALNWPSYTPRATWYRLQTQYLKRKSYELTEGKPGFDPDGKEVKPMKARRDKSAVLEEVLKVIENHGDPVAWFEMQGYAAPLTSWQDLKKWTRIHRPDDMQKLPNNLWKYYAANGIKRPGKDDAAPKASENPPKEVKAAEAVVVNGKEYEKYEGVKEYPPLPGATDKDAYGNHPVTAYIEKEPSPTCCQPARSSGVTVPDELPKESPMEVIGIRSKVKGYYMKADLDPKLTRDDGYVHLIWRDLITKGELSIGMSVSEWMELSKEIPMAMQQLGLLSK